MNIGRVRHVLSMILAIGAAEFGAGFGLRSAEGQTPPFPIAPVADSAPLAVPEGLPRYDIRMRVDPARRSVEARERVTFTNRSPQPVGELVFHVYPRYKPPEGDRAILVKTLESLRVAPEFGLDFAGRRLTIESVSLEGQALAYGFDDRNDTILTVELPEAVPSGESVSVDIQFRLDLPDKWGRWGHHRGITYLANWHPTLAVLGEKGWDKSPFVPWHQSWHQEAGHYQVEVDLPESQTIASSGRIVSEARSDRGWKRVAIAAGPSRDFTLVCSDRFQVWERQAGRVKVRVLAWPEHKDNAKRALEYACEVIPLYESWFGPYQDDEFEIAASFFGWNANECSGLVLLDERIMRLSPMLSPYLDLLVTHETCHQWWWAAVGTNGYAETVMDEGPVTAFSHIRLAAKYGERNAGLLLWPEPLQWLPSVGLEDYRISGYYRWRRKAVSKNGLRDLHDIGNLTDLFSLAYDRGGKIVDMMRNRLGDERFFTFFQRLYRRYAFRICSFEDFRRELIAFDPGQDWGRFLDAWVIEGSELDYRIASVDVMNAPDPDQPSRRRIQITLEHRGPIAEPTLVRLRFADRTVDVPIQPDRPGFYRTADADVRASAPGPGPRPGFGVSDPCRRWTVTVFADDPLVQAEADPDRILLDSEPNNNRWRREPEFRLTPLVTPFHDSNLFLPYDRPTITVGPFVDDFGRFGLMGSYQRPHQFRASVWGGVQPNHFRGVLGGGFEMPHAFGFDQAFGGFYEQGIYYDWGRTGDRVHDGGGIYYRKHLFPATGTLQRLPAFAELYYGFGNQFWQGDTGRPVTSHLAAVGARFRLDTQFPYWDPDDGRLIEASGEYGDRALGSSRDYTRFAGTIAQVGRFPETFGPLSQTKWAVKLTGGAAFPDDVRAFRLGGQDRLRALALNDREGSAVWIATAEWRVPLRKAINRDFADRAATVNQLYGVAFYDAGQSFYRGRATDIVHGVGLGLRLDVSLFTFVDRANLRFDIAQPLIEGGSPMYWFGIDQAF